MRNCLALLILLTGFSCKIDRDKKVDREKFTFTMGDDSELFFRNTRQIFYDRYSPDGTWQAYRFSERYKGNDRPLIIPVIVINWLEDEAYLLIESNEALASEDEIRVIISNPQQKTDTLVLRERGMARMLEFGSQLYEALQYNSKIMVLNHNEYVPVLMEETDREMFRITMSDFYRLTRIF